MNNLNNEIVGQQRKQAYEHLESEVVPEVNSKAAFMSWTLIENKYWTQVYNMIYKTIQDTK